MDLDIIILNDYHTKESKSQRGRQIPYDIDITYMWNIRYDINEHIYETETSSQTWRTDFWLPKGRGSRGGKDYEWEGL